MLSKSKNCLADLPRSYRLRNASCDNPSDDTDR